ncbi:unnamed protein product, partial [Porites lobata]
HQQWSPSWSPLSLPSWIIPRIRNQVEITINYQPKPAATSRFVEKAEDFNNAGNDAYRKKDFAKAIFFYTEGIKVECKDKEFVSKLYNNRSTVYFYQGNYQDCLSDVKAATTLKASYLKAIIRDYLKHLYTCKIDPDKQDLLEIKSRSNKERETLPTLGGDKAERAEGGSRPHPKPLDCTSIAETRKKAGNDAFHKDDFNKAINLYTEGIEVKCRDEDLNAKLYNNRATAHYRLGHYHDCLGDVKAATALHPSNLKAIIRGENERNLKN